MLTFTDDERAYLTEMRAITTDRQGREHLVGLTIEETEWYLTYTRARTTGASRGPDDGHKFLALVDKHERARLHVIFAEVEARNNNSMRH